MTTTRFNAAYGLALFLALETCSTVLLGWLPGGSLGERTFGWSAVLATIIAPAALWLTRKTRAARYLQDGFIVVAIAGVVAGIILSCVG